MRSALSHSACTSTGLPMRGVITRSPTFASIQVSCTPGHAGGEQPVGVHADAVARAGAVAGDDLADRVLQQLLVGRQQRDAARAGRLEQLVRRDHVPERGVDRVVFGLLAGVREAVRQHAFGHRRRPVEQDVARQLEPAGQAQKPRSAMNVSRPQSVNQG